MFFSTPSWNRLCLILGSPRHPQAAKIRPKSLPELPKLIFGPIAYFVARANEKHTFCIPQIAKNHQKSGKNASYAGARKKEGLQGRLLAIFGDFGGPQGGSKIIKNRKKAFQKSIEKKDETKKGHYTRWGRGSAAKVQPRESKIPLRKALAKSGKQIQNTPALPAECGGLAGYAIFRRPL